MFKDAKVGDRVWSVGNGWGTVRRITRDEKFPIKVAFDNGDTGSFILDGKEFVDNSYPTLFWDEVKITPPPRPKRKEKRVIEGYLNIYPTIYTSKEQAIAGQGPNALGEPFFVHHEYEVEVD